MGLFSKLFGKAVEDAAGYVDEAKEDVKEAGDAHGAGAHFDNVGFVNKDADNLLAENLDEWNHHCGENCHHKESAVVAFYNTVVFAGTVVLAAEGGKGGTHGLVRLMNNLFNAACGGKGGNGNCTKGVYYPL